MPRTLVHSLIAVLAIVAAQSPLALAWAIEPSGEYRILPLDRLNISVLQVQDFKLDDVEVDAVGEVNLPLIGSVKAAGLSATELADEIERKLGATYLQTPEVTVVVSASVSQTVTVEGAVQQPGVFQLAGRTTLLQAVAMARGPSAAANDRQVTLFRKTEASRTGSTFDLRQIRDGSVADPLIRAGDIVVVQESRGRAVWNEFMRSVPALGFLGRY